MTIPWEKVARTFRYMTLGAVMLLPVGVYIDTFGYKISDTHGRWAEMGSAMSGIYGPILSVLTFLVLIMQVRLQRQTNKHMYEQAYFQDARADIEFYLTQLSEVLDKPSSDGLVPRTVLHSQFERASVEQLSSDELKGLALAFDQRFPHLQSIWHAMYSMYTGLSVNKGYPYDLPYTAAKQKTVVMVSFPTCVALDHYLYCIMGAGRISYRYEFARNLA
jgi:hypothetical protein